MARRTEAVAGSALQTVNAFIPKTIAQFRQDKGCDFCVRIRTEGPERDSVTPQVARRRVG